MIDYTEDAKQYISLSHEITRLREHIMQDKKLLERIQAELSKLHFQKLGALGLKRVNELLDEHRR